MSQLRSQESTDSLKNVIFLQFLGKSRYSTKLWKSFIDCFNCMPVAALIE